MPCPTCQSRRALGDPITEPEWRAHVDPDRIRPWNEPSMGLRALVSECAQCHSSSTLILEDLDLGEVAA